MKYWVSMCCTYTQWENEWRFSMLIRKANVYDISDIAKVHVEAWQTTYDRIMSQEYLESMTLDKRKKFWLKFINDGKSVYVVEEKNGEIVGFAVPKVGKTEDNGYIGEVSAMYILEQFQRKGIGKKLLLTCAKLLQNLEINKMVVWVLKDNPACEFYKAMGGMEKDAKIDRIDSKDLLKLAYVWDDLRELIHNGEKVKENKFVEFESNY